MQGVQGNGVGVMGERTPYDGKPYYCEVCGLGLSEFMACEEPDCKLEDSATAQLRAIQHIDQAALARAGRDRRERSEVVDLKTASALIENVRGRNG